MRKILRIIMATITCGTMTACAQTAFESVSPQQFREMIESDPKAYILDVRTPEEFDEGHITKAHNLDWLNQQAFKQGATSLPKDDTIYVYCRSGKRSAEASQYLAAHGYKVVDLEGGWLAWTGTTIQ